MDKRWKTGIIILIVGTIGFMVLGILRINQDRTSKDIRAEDVDRGEGRASAVTHEVATPIFDEESKDTSADRSELSKDMRSLVPHLQDVIAGKKLMQFIK